MASADLEALRRLLAKNVFVDQKAVDGVVGALSAGDITEADALSRLRKLQRAAEGAPRSLSPQEADQAWRDLLEAMAGESTEWQRIAKTQFYQGLATLPLGLALVMGILVLIVRASPGLTLAVTPVLVASLTAIGLHAFLLLRVHQQARVAAERISEKRAAILFLRLALGRTSPAEVSQLLSAGTAMFLGHHAVPAVPLQPEDFQRGNA